MEPVSLKHEFEYQVSRGELTSAEQSLRVSLARTGKGKFAKSIFFGWSNVETASRNLARVLTHQFPNVSGTGYLLDEALQTACGTYEKLMENSSLDTHAMAMYLKSLLDVSSEHLMAWDTHGILANGETVLWPIVGQPLIEWVKRKGVERLVFSRRQAVTPDQVAVARTALAGSIFSINDLLHIESLPE